MEGMTCSIWFGKPKVRSTLTIYGPTKSGKSSAGGNIFVTRLESITELLPRRANSPIKVYKRLVRYLSPPPGSKPAPGTPAVAPKKKAAGAKPGGPSFREDCLPQDGKAGAL